MAFASREVTDLWFVLVGAINDTAPKFGLRFLSANLTSMELPPRPLLLNGITFEGTTAIFESPEFPPLYVPLLDLPFGPAVLRHLLWLAAVFACCASALSFCDLMDEESIRQSTVRQVLVVRLRAFVFLITYI